MSERSIASALAAINIPALPKQRFAGILQDSKLRSLTQAMCLTGAQAAQAQQDEFLVDLTASTNTGYYRLNSDKFGCAIEKLTVEFSSPISQYR